jgi:hypothetical protein
MDGTDITATFVIGRFSSFGLIAVGVGIVGHASVAANAAAVGSSRACRW